MIKYTIYDKIYHLVKWEWIEIILSRKQSNTTRHAYIEIHRVREMKGTQQQPEDSAPRFQPGWNVLIGSSKAGSLAGAETNDKVL